MGDRIAPYTPHKHALDLFLRVQFIVSEANGRNWTQIRLGDFRNCLTDVGNRHVRENT